MVRVSRRDQPPTLRREGPWYGTPVRRRRGRGPPFPGRPAALAGEPASRSRGPPAAWRASGTGPHSPAADRPGRTRLLGALQHTRPSPPGHINRSSPNVQVAAQAVAQGSGAGVRGTCVPPHQPPAQTAQALRSPVYSAEGRLRRRQFDVLFAPLAGCFAQFPHGTYMLSGSLMSI